MRSIRRKVESFAGDRGFSEVQVGDLSLAVAEALFNAMEHGSTGTGTLLLEIDYCADHLEVAVEDGGGAEEVEHRLARLRRALNADPTDDVPEADLERGRGLYLIRAKTDGVRVERTGNGVRMVMVKRKE
ncbi:MAG: ATP-binding protein [Planctomycetota bacterium]